MKKIFTLIAIVSLAFTGKANNILLANVALNGQNTTSQFSLVNFDVSWQNSWRTITNEANYDGAWIFVKFRKKTSNTWEHATISATGSTMPANSAIKTSTDGKGAWIYRSLPVSDFTGDVTYTGAKIQWNYGLDGVLNTDSVEIRVFALEMVYATAGTFKLGTGGSEVHRFFVGSTNNPYNVTSESSIIVANTAGNLFYDNLTGLAGDQTGPIPANFPKGFNAFWVMKYESSQQQYVDFLNNVDIAKANNRYAGIYTGTHPNLVAPFPVRAATNMNVPDVLAFSDWAGLRPITELEYEKAARGYNQAATANEFAWGNTTISFTSTLTNIGLENEMASNGNANFNNGNGTIGFPIRCGIYATASSNREQSGGTYYGIMDMSGNVIELTISIGTASSRAFTNANGDGNLTATGNQNVPTWPDGNNLSYMLKGGGFDGAPGTLRISERGGNNTFTGRQGNLGIRLGRSAD